MARRSAWLGVLALAACAPAVPVEVHELPNVDATKPSVEPTEAKESDATADEPLACETRAMRWWCSAPALTAAVVRRLEPERRRHPETVALAIDAATEQDLDLLERVPDLTGLEIKDARAITSLAPLAPLKGLEVLALAARAEAPCPLRDLRGLERALDLAELRIEHCPDLVDLGALDGHARLKELRLASVGVGDVTGIGRLGNLVALALVKTRVEDLDPIGALTSLAYLDLSGSPVKDVRAIASLAGLVTLRLDGVHATTAGRTAGPVASLAPAIAPLDYLEEVSLEDAGLGDVDFLRSKLSIHVLDLAKNHLHDLTPLASLSGLAALDLGDNPITDVKPLGALDDLVKLSLADAPVKNAAPLAKLVHLEELDLRGTPIASVGPLAQLSGLRVLRLDRTPVADVTPLRALRRLTSLSLRTSKVTSVRALADLPELASIDLAGTRVTDAATLARAGRAITPPDGR